MSFPKYRAAGIIDGADWDDFVLNMVAHSLRHVLAGVDPIITPLDARAIALTTHGDVVFSGAGNLLTRLPAGAVGDVLTSGGVGADVSWVAPGAPGAHEATHVRLGVDDIDSALDARAIALAAQGEVVYHAAGANTLAGLAVGVAGEALITGGPAANPSWAAPAPAAHAASHEPAGADEVNDIDIGNTGVLLSAHKARHEATGADAFVGGDLLDATARVMTRRNTGANVGPRRRLNFIEGANVTLGVVDDGANEEVDITITAAGGGGGGLTEFSYLIVMNNGTYSTYDNQGSVVHGPSAGADADVEVNWAFNAGGAGTVVELAPDTTFVLADPIAFTANNQILQGGGRGSFIDGDGLATTEHGIVLSGFVDCQIRNLSIQTQDGGTKTCHCIFVEDGADRFHIENVWIVDSDDDGIHIEGTEIIDGWIVSCKLLDADGHAISVDMDGANYMYNLHISGCTSLSAGGNGFSLTDLRGGKIEENIITDSVGDGIELNDSTYCVLDGNISYANGEHGIHLVGSSDCTVSNNICDSNDSGDSATYDGIHVSSTSLRNLIGTNNCNGNHRYGIYAEAVNTSIKGNYVSTNDRHGIAAYGAEILIGGNYVYDNGQDAVGTYHGIYLSGAADRSLIVGNYCGDPGDTQEDGIHLADGAMYGSIIGNYCYYLLGDGIHLAGTNTKTLIEANHCYFNYENGIIITDSVDCSMRGNHCNVNVQHGIYLDNADQTSVTNNSCMGNDSGDTASFDGIYIDADSSNNMIIANKCNDNDRYGITVGGSLHRVKENEFDGNTAGCFNDTGTDTAVPFIYCRVTDPNDNIGTHPTVRLEDDTDTHIYDQIYVPLEFQELVTAQVIVVTSVTGNMVWTLDTNWGKLCVAEAYDTATDTDGATTGLVIDDLECVDISAAFTGIAPGDLIGLDFMRDGDDGSDTIGDVVYYMGIRVRYV